MMNFFSIIENEYLEKWWENNEILNTELRPIIFGPGNRVKSREKLIGIAVVSQLAIGSETGKISLLSESAEIVRAS